MARGWLFAINIVMEDVLRRIGLSLISTSSFNVKVVSFYDQHLCFARGDDSEGRGPSYSTNDCGMLILIVFGHNSWR